MSVRKRTWVAPNGEMHAAWQVDYRDQAGTRRSRQFSRKKDAEAWLVDAAYQVSKGVHTHDRNSMTVAQACDIWIAKAEAEGRERSTIKSYRELARLHIVPLIGGQRLARLTAPVIEQFRDDLVSIRSRAMAGKAVRALSSVIAEAVRRGVVAQNVAANVRVVRPSRGKVKPDIPSAIELRSILAAANDNERAMLMLMIATGIRTSEMRGLLWQDIDLDAARISVTQRADAWGVIGPPKSAAGRRTIPIPPELVTELRKWSRQGRASPSGIVFPSNKGTPLQHNNLLRRVFVPLQIRAGVSKPCLARNGDVKVDGDGNVILAGKYGFHALRHAAASNWIASGIDLKRLQSWLGHSSVQMTLDCYGHLMMDEDRDASLALSASRALLAA